MEALLRLGVSLAILLLMVSWEFFTPLRAAQQTRRKRWPVNLGLAGFNMLLMRFSLGSAAWLAAQWAVEQKAGLFNSWPMPVAISIPASLLLLDLAIYAQHIAAHRWSWFWRLHQVHHSDLDFDTTTAVRFHPLEIMASMFYKVVVVILLGVAPDTVMAFEIILNGCALFNHGNVSLSPRLESVLRYVLITPDLHRIHHSASLEEMDSNYGFSLSCWDRIFRTYRPKARQPQATLTLGLRGLENPAELGFGKLLVLPFGAEKNRSR